MLPDMLARMPGHNWPVLTEPRAATRTALHGCLLLARPCSCSSQPAEEGRKAVSEAMRLCEDSALECEDDATALRDWAASAWDYMVGQHGRGGGGIWEVHEE